MRSIFHMGSDVILTSVLYFLGDNATHVEAKLKRKYGTFLPLDHKLGNNTFIYGLPKLEVSPSENGIMSKN